jgi:hypothetical protein
MFLLTRNQVVYPKNGESVQIVQALDLGRFDAGGSDDFPVCLRVLAGVPEDCEKRKV